MVESRQNSICPVGQGLLLPPPPPAPPAPPLPEPQAKAAIHVPMTNDPARRARTTTGLFMCKPPNPQRKRARSGRQAIPPAAESAAGILSNLRSERPGTRAAVGRIDL